MVIAFFAALALAAAAPSPWDGDWVLNAARSSPDAKENAADGYRFHVAGGRIRWQIPSLAEDFEVPIGGPPAAIRRKGADTGTTIAVRAAGPTAFTYAVSRGGVVGGEGRMTLVDGGKAWVDIVWPAGKPDLASQIVYVKR